MLSLRRNIAANYASQVYVALIGILMLPIYIKYMGAEAYGLIGFFTMMQAWFNLLDLGLTPTIGRETARYRAGFADVLSFRRLYRALSAIFILIAMIGGTGLLVLSSTIAKDWLNTEELSLNEIQIAVQIMAISVALRWMCGLFRGVITGSERLVWLGGFNAFVASLRFIGVLAVMWWFGFTPFVFFSYQLVIAIIEIAGLWLKSTYLILSQAPISEPIGWSLNPVRPLIKFSLTIAFTASVWVMVTQTDKLILSSILPLSEYGFFTLSVLVANGIMLLSGPISNAIMPRLAKLEAEGNRKEVIQVYRQSTRLVTVIAGSAAATLAFCAEPLLWAWTGDFALARKSAPILTLYAIGNGALAVAAFPYYLQYARGDLRLHFIGHLLLLLILIPSIVLAANFYGAIGAGYVWVVVNLLYLFVWVAIMHRKLEPGLHWKWLFNDVLMIGLPIGVLGIVVLFVELNLTSRLGSLVYVMAFGVIAALLAAFMSSDIRNFISKLKAKVV
ncbi:MAG: oligosaccharide flippase family protein [Gammaproteobacteria bacterium]|nr:oligosaccharide flippase family protein [Gammaproteobacteria bacterium]